MTTINYINASLEIWGCVMSAIVALCLFLGKHKQDICSRLYLNMLAYNMGVLLFDLLALFCRGHSGLFFWWGVRLTNFISFACGYLLMLSFVCYLTQYIGQYTQVIKVPLKVSQGICALSLGLLVLTQFVPVFYTIDAQNIYRRADLFWLSQALGIVCIFLCAWFLWRYREYLEPQEKAALWSYILLPLAALGIQMFVYGLVVLNLVNTVSILVIFLFIQAEQGRRAAKQETLLIRQELELADSRRKIMLSQIQPHFLYNTLGSISYLCEKDPMAAQSAVNDFAEYLRGNLDSLKRSAPVSFDMELKHIQIYLSLEKMRFDDELSIVYDVETTCFLLPALTVQPLVENAVKYGVGRKPGGGTVTIATREYDDRFEITVSDDGVGYDVNEPQYDGRTHIGIDNVRARLAAMVNGTLTIKSTKGVGTVATVTVPKEGIR